MIRTFNEISPSLRNNKNNTNKMKLREEIACIVWKIDIFGKCVTLNNSVM